MAIADIFLRFKNQVETSDQQKDGQLKTHYYKGSFDQIFESVEEIIRQDADCLIKTVSKEQGEITVELTEPRICCLTATVVSSKSAETAVNFSISAEKPTLLGNYKDLKKRIISFYERINNQHTLMMVNKNS